MEKIFALIEILKIIAAIFRDSDGDGRPDFVDNEPDNPEVQ